MDSGYEQFIVHMLKNLQLAFEETLAIDNYWHLQNREQEEPIKSHNHISIQTDLVVQVVFGVVDLLPSSDPNSVYQIFIEHIAVMSGGKCLVFDKGISLLTICCRLVA